MKTKLFQANLRVQTSPIAGFGVFADQDFSPGDLIEECHVLKTETKTILNDYLFATNQGFYAMCLGYGAIFNHADNPNAQYEYDAVHNLMRFSASAPIKRGEEILISYGKTWFSERGITVNFPWRYKLQKRLPRWLIRFGLVTCFLICLINVLGH